MSLTSTHLSCQAYICKISAGLLAITSGTTAGQRRDDLLPFRREGGNAQLDLVAARLLVVGDGFAQATSSSWTKPCANHTLAVVAAAGQYGRREGASRGESQGSSKHRTPGEIGHGRISLPPER